MKTMKFEVQIGLVEERGDKLVRVWKAAEVEVSKAELFDTTDDFHPGLNRNLTHEEKTHVVKHDLFDAAIQKAIRKIIKEDVYAIRSNLTPFRSFFDDHLCDLYYKDGGFRNTIPVQVIKAEEI